MNTEVSTGLRNCFLKYSRILTTMHKLQLLKLKRMRESFTHISLVRSELYFQLMTTKSVAARSSSWLST